MSQIETEIDEDKLHTSAATVERTIFPASE